MVFGRPEPLQVIARVVSQGPVIDIQPPSLDWGLVPVLTPHYKTVTVANQAPVPASLTAHMVGGSAAGLWCRMITVTLSLPLGHQ